MQGGKNKMPIKPREMEKIILADGWIFKNQVGAISKGKQRRLKCASLFYFAR